MTELVLLSMQNVNLETSNDIIKLKKLKIFFGANVMFFIQRSTPGSVVPLTMFVYLI